MVKKYLMTLLSVGVLWCWVEIMPPHMYTIPQRPYRVQRDHIYKCWTVKRPKDSTRHTRRYGEHHSRYIIEKHCQWTHPY